MGFYTQSFKISTAAISANGQYRAFAVAMRLLNAALTFAFGYRYGAYIIPTGNATLSAILGGLAFALIFDVAAFGWDAAARRDGISPEQRLKADNMATVSMWASTAISAVQLALTTPLVDLSAMYDGIGMAALAMSTVLLAAHFVQAFAYRNLSPESIEARIDAELRSTLQAMQRRQREELALKVTDRVAERMIDNIDRFADLEAAKVWKKLTTDMGHGNSGGGAQVQSSPEEEPTTTKTSPPTEPVTETETDTDFIDYEELKGNARTGLHENLNMASA
ncbi:hypothetical protein [Lewinella sp. W8]|uniref:hypothetical protein n=1 Tax=Lewinella sp. W8 TaxID=2528208 RepID=UPI0010675629|nr:hypothetical protein [Lewinella sp. W8]MTB49807.1 hypothetical protein [Lewinella sp. W8]